MRHDPAAPFGFHAPGTLPRALIGFCQAQPLTPMGRRLALWLRRVAMLLQGPVFDVAVRGINLRLYPDDNVGERKFLFMPQFFDPAEMALLADRLPRDGTFVDIGANVGLYTLNAARLLGPAGRILAIEPGPEAARRLRFNLSINRTDAAITHVDCAIGAEEGVLGLYLDNSNLGGSSLVRDHGGASTPVRVRPLLDVLGGAGVTGIDVLKIDIEGAEDKALLPFFAAAPESLWPRVIIIERSQESWGGDLLGRLKAAGYRAFGDSRMNWLFERG
ncbi:FkbM family methyltransferase [Niveispirillum fermenti]|uniref:FkbM family methyltransferase n=1 Tax=Niveispirillum fermenti TaxID=1233113 RepID=UPI003A87456C